VTAGHAQGAYVVRDTPVHRLPADCKLVAMVAFVFIVVATPPQAYWAFACYAVLLTAVMAVAQIPLLLVLRRMLIEVPFVFFAVLLPLIATGPRIEILGFSVSESGLIGAWNILAKGTIGVVSSILLAATTELRDLLLALERLRVPTILVQIASFMLRYVNVILGEMHRMRVARESRGWRARDLRDFGVIAQSAGALFIRSYERGERVYLAMLSRGYTGGMPRLGGEATVRMDQWLRAALLPVSALAVAVVAWMLSR
jgi:cobalt/nickel transport system permease protein